MVSKTEAIIYAAVAIGDKGGKVLIGCPTGIQVSAYKDRLPSDARIVVETVHSTWKLPRKTDQKTYASPGRLRAYDAIAIEEVSQLDENLLDLILKAVYELPQKPLLLLVGDFQQMSPSAVHEGQRNPDHHYGRARIRS